MSLNSFIIWSGDWVKKGERKEKKEDVFFGLSLELSLCLHQMETSGVHLCLSPTTPPHWEKAAKGVRTEKCLCSSVSKCFTATSIYWFSPSTLSPLPPYKTRDWAPASRQEGSLLLPFRNLHVPMQCLQCTCTQLGQLAKRQCQKAAERNVFQRYPRESGHLVWKAGNSSFWPHGYRELQLDWIEGLAQLFSHCTPCL